MSCMILPLGFSAVALLCIHSKSCQCAANWSGAPTGEVGNLGEWATFSFGFTYVSFVVRLVQWSGVLFVLPEPMAGLECTMLISNIVFQSLLFTAIFNGINIQSIGASF